MPPFSPLHLLLFLFALVFLIALIQVGLISIAFEKLGVSSAGAFTLLFGSLVGSAINVPLFRIRAEPPALPAPPMLRLLRPAQPFTGYTVIAVNMGGCLIPLTFCTYLIASNPIPAGATVLAIGLVAAVCYWVSRPLPGIGIGMPIFVAPLAAAATAMLLAPEQSAPVAYICGTAGVLLGADLLRLKDVRQLGAPVASIGGAGTFDGIFVTGIVAVLLA